MTQKTTVPFHIQILGWLCSLSAFALGFWHTHHGLKAMKPLGSEYGSYIVAGLISMVLIIAYSRAVSGVGVKKALFFYLICAMLNFTFNTNSFYPTLLGRKLLKEETTALNDKLQNYSAKLDSIYATYGNNSDLPILSDLKTKKSALLDEISRQDGFGPDANKLLLDFNTLAKSQINPQQRLGASVIEREASRDYYEKETNRAIDDYVQNYIAEGDKNKMIIISNKKLLDSLKIIYTPAFERILVDNSKIEINDSVIDNHPQIDTLKLFTTKFDNICNAVNIASKNEILRPLNYDKKAQNLVPKIQNLGKFEYTIASVWERINRIDTWGILLIVLLIDFITPLAMYFMIKGGDSTDQSGKIGKIFGKKSPEKF